MAQERIKQSIAYWCFQDYWSLEEICKIATELGCKSVELVDPGQWDVLKKHGLACGLTLSHWFERGMNNPLYQPECLEKLKEAIDATAAAGFPNVLTFTGFRGDISDDDGIRNCVNGYKKIVGYAEKRKVNLCLEMLNTRVDVEMKGHPGYQGDSVEYCMEIVRQVGSPSMRLLFDIYHVQIMQGDLVTRIVEYRDFIGHYHVAGNPGRNEPGENQEINYRRVLRAIAESGFSGYVGQEFLPTGDPLVSLREAVRVCDV